MFQLWIGFDFRIWGIEFVFVFCWFSSCVPVDGDSEHQMTLTNTSVKNIRPVYFFLFVCFLVVCISVDWVLKALLQFLLNVMNHVILLVLTKCAKLFCEGMTFALTAFCTEKKNEEWKMKKKKSNSLWFLSKWPCSKRSWDSEFAPVVCGRLCPEYYWCCGLISEILFSANVRIHAKPLVLTVPQS